MVEQWSSKSHAWVRFLLPLLLHYKLIKNNKNLKNKKKQTINLFKKNLLKFYQKKSIKFFKNTIINNYRNKNNLFFQFLNSKYNFTKHVSPILWNLYLLKFIYINFNFNKRNNLFFICTNHINLPTFNFFKLKTNVCTTNQLSPILLNFFKNNTFTNTFSYFYYLNYYTILNDNNNNKFNIIKKNIFYKKSIIKNNQFFKKIDYRNTQIRELYKMKKNKINLNLNISPNNYILYYYKSKFFFTKFNTLFKRFNKNLFSICKLTQFDWINFFLAKLNNNSSSLDLFNFFQFKINPPLKTFKYKIFKILNIHIDNDTLFENNYFSQNIPKSSINSTITPLTIYFKNLINHPFNKNINEVKNIYNFNNLIKSHSYNKLNYFNKIESILLLISKPLLFKYILYKFNNNLLNFNFYNKIIYNLNEYYYYSKNNKHSFTNIIPNKSFFFILKKKILKVFKYNKFPTITSTWHYHTLIKFFEFCSGKKIYIKFNSFINNNLTFNERTQCLMWAQRVKYFRKVLGPRLFLNESLQIIYISLKLKDPFVLSNWINITMQKISFWKYKTFLRYIKYVLRYFFWIMFRELNIKGLKFQLKGKVSVAGNARTRTVFHTIGFTSHATFNNKILYKLDLIRTFTGVLGLKLWIVF